MSTMLSAFTIRLATADAATSRPNCFSIVAKAVAFVLIFSALICAAQPAAAQFLQQGAKLVGTGAAGDANQGSSTALSANGNTAAVGGYNDASVTGAVWVFTRSGGLWTQQGAKLVGTGVEGSSGSAQGSSVALSGDGNTALVGGPYDRNLHGSAWVFIRSNGVWTQQGTKLSGNDVSPFGSARLGWSVALSADGNTALVGGFGDNSGVGAA